MTTLSTQQSWLCDYTVRAYSCGLCDYAVGDHSVNHSTTTVLDHTVEFWMKLHSMKHRRNYTEMNLVLKLLVKISKLLLFRQFSMWTMINSEFRLLLRNNLYFFLNRFSHNPMIHLIRKIWRHGLWIRIVRNRIGSLFFVVTHRRTPRYFDTNK